jgi:hypothetical protein
LFREAGLPQDLAGIGVQGRRRAARAEVGALDPERRTATVSKRPAEACSISWK